MPTDLEPYEPITDIDSRILSGEIPWRESFLNFKVLEQVLREASRIIARNPTTDFDAKYKPAVDEYVEKRNAERQERLERRKPIQTNGYHHRKFEEDIVSIAVIDPGSKTKTTMTPRIQWSDGWCLYYRERLDDDTSPTRTRGLAATREGVVVALREAESFLAEMYTQPATVSIGHDR